MSETLQTGSLVLAKMKGFPPWPGIIAEPPDFLKKQFKKNAHCIFFFGTNNYSYIETSQVSPYKEPDMSKAKASFKEAVHAIQEYISRGSKGDYDPSASVNKTPGKKNDVMSKRSSQGKPKDTPKDKPNTPKTLEKAKDATPAKRKLTKGTPDTSSAKKLKKRNSSLNEVEGSGSAKSNRVSRFSPQSTVSTPFRPSSYLLERPNILPSEYEPLSANVSRTLQDKNIKPSKLKFGFIGLGNIGRILVKNLLDSNHKVIVWTRTADKATDFLKLGAELAQTPEDAVSSADITFCCVSNPSAVNDIVLGNCGVINGISNGKGYVELTNVDPASSEKIAACIKEKGGRYLEAQLQGSKEEAEDGVVIIIAAGDRELYVECQSCFEAFGKSSFYLGKVGSACSMNLVIQIMRGITIAGLAECMALAERTSLVLDDVVEVFSMCPLSSELLLEKGKAIAERQFTTSWPLQHLQKDLQLALKLSEQLKQPLPLTAYTNEIYTHAKRLGYGDHDASAVYIRTRF